MVLDERTWRIRTALVMVILVIFVTVLCKTYYSWLYSCVGGQMKGYYKTAYNARTFAC